MSDENIKPFDVLIRKPREGQRELLISIPKHVQDKLHLGKNTWLDMVVMKNFVLLKRFEKDEYRSTPLPEILSLLDEALEIYREKEKSVDQRVMELCNKISKLSRGKMDKTGGLHFTKGTLTEEDVFVLLENILDKQNRLKDDEMIEFL